MHTPILYKYCSWDSRCTKSNLKKNVVYFASPDTCNDPHDCMLLANFDGWSWDKLKNLALSDSQFTERVITGLKQMGKNVDLQMFLAYLSTPTAETEIRNALSRDLDSVMIAQRNTVTGILSLTPAKRNLLMWSHYADKHRGFCIGYSTSVLMEVFKAKASATVAFFARNVHYAEEYPNITAGDFENLGWALALFTTKAIGWAYEVEFRFLIFGNTNVEIDLPKEAVVEVIFGYWMRPENKAEIKHCLKEAGVRPKYFEARKKEKEFGLDIIPVDE